MAACTRPPLVGTLVPYPVFGTLVASTTCRDIRALSRVWHTVHLHTLSRHSSLIPCLALLSSPPVVGIVVPYPVFDTLFTSTPWRDTRHLSRVWHSALFHPLWGRSSLIPCLALCTSAPLVGTLVPCLVFGSLRSFYPLNGHSSLIPCLTHCSPRFLVGTLGPHPVLGTLRTSTPCRDTRPLSRVWHCAHVHPL